MGSTTMTMNGHSKNGHKNGHKRGGKRIDFTKLTRADFRVLLLAYVEKKHGGALAAKLGMSEGQVRYRLGKAGISMRKLRDGEDPIAEQINRILADNPAVTNLVVKQCRRAGVFEAPNDHVD